MSNKKKGVLLILAPFILTIINFFIYAVVSYPGSSGTSAGSAPTPLAGLMFLIGFLILSSIPIFLGLGIYFLLKKN